MSKSHLLSLAFSTTLLIGCGGGEAVIPTSYSNFMASDRTFQCDAPDGWEKTSGGSPGVVANASFKSGSASIAIKADLAGSAMAGPMGVRDDDADPSSHPAQRLHEMGKRQFEEDFGKVEEKPIEVFRAKIAEGRLTEFTAAGGMGGKIQGFRATMLSNDRRITVICQCPDASWEKLKPVFRKVIESIAIAPRN